MECPRGIGEMSIDKLFLMLKGGAGSGNFGHAGRPGKRGGSGLGSGSGVIKQIENKWKKKKYPQNFSEASREEGEFVASYRIENMTEANQTVIDMGYDSLDDFETQENIPRNKLIGTYAFFDEDTDFKYDELYPDTGYRTGEAVKTLTISRRGKISKASLESTDLYTDDKGRTYMNYGL